MIGTVILSLLLQSPAAQDGQPIVVTGRRSTADHELCSRGGCPPVRDANASLAHAERQLLAGDYADARRTVRAAIRRNAGAERTHPKVLSALYDADSTLALHLGERDEARRSGLRSAALLRGAADDAVARVLARVRAGDVEVRVGRADDADRAYEAAAEEARRAGLVRLADSVEVRRVWLLSLRGQSTAAQSRLARVAEDPARDPKLRTAAAVLAARIAGERGDEAAVERMLAVVGQRPDAARPLLLSSPLPLAVPAATQEGVKATADRFGERSALDPVSAQIVPLRWVDIGFWVRPDGSVDDVQILRGTRVRAWAAPIVRSIGARRYAAFSAEADDPGRYRIERFTLTADVQMPKGSLIARRVGPTTLRHLDISDDPARRPGTR